MQTLVEQGWIRVVEYTDMNVRKLNAEKKRTYFPCDLSNTDVEVQVPDHCKNYICSLWANELQQNVVFNWEKIFQDHPNLLSDQEREVFVTRQSRNQAKIDQDKEVILEDGKRRKRRSFKPENVHMVDVLDVTQEFWLIWIMLNKNESLSCQIRTSQSSHNLNQNKDPNVNMCTIQTSQSDFDMQSFNNSRPISTKNILVSRNPPLQNLTHKFTPRVDMKWTPTTTSSIANSVGQLSPVRSATPSQFINE